MSFTKVEVPGNKYKKKLAIRSYHENGVENMGLEKHGMALHEGVYHTEQLCCLEANGIKRYITGLNEFAPEVKMIKDPEAKAAKILEIRTIVAQLEQEFAANVIKVDDEDFWQKVQVLSPTNSEFWDKIELKAGNDPVYLDPAKNPYDLIAVCAIEAGGFDMCASSLSALMQLDKPKKFYLDKEEETTNTKNTLRKIRNKALSALQKMYDEDSTKLLYVTKCIDPSSPQYKKDTAHDLLYEAMDNFINGLSIQKDKKKAAQLFLDTTRMSVGDLKLTSLIKDGIYYKFIQHKTDGHLQHRESGTLMGRSVAGVHEFLKNPINEDVLEQLQYSVEAEWNK